MHIICKNCDNHYTGNFCPKCGQKAAVHRITIVHVLEEFWHNFTHTDKNYFSYALTLISNPGMVISEYIQGKRVKYFNPYTFYLVTTSLLVLIVKSVFHLENEKYQTNNEFGYYTDSNINIIILCMLPLLTLIFQLFYREKKLNYAESFTALIIMFSLMNLFLLVTNLFYLIFIQYHFTTYGYLLMIGYLFVCWALFNYAKPKNVWQFLKPIIISVIFYFCVEFIGKGIALWFWGMPFEKVLKLYN
ncbi:hypothetical protein BH09BAC5_BH09BAC5_27540 [soil metagenome]